MQIKKVNFFGIKVASLTYDQLHQIILDLINNKKKLPILNINVNALYISKNDPIFREILYHTDLVFADGNGIVFGLKLLGKKIPYRITYADWIWAFANFSCQNNISWYFLGSKPGVAEKAAQNLKIRYKFLKIVGCHHGYFSKYGIEDSKIIHEINIRRPNVLFVCLGMPLQEKWIYRNIDKIQSNILLPGGACLDYISKNKSRCPKWMGKIGLEWLYRLFTEPTRLGRRYIFGNLYFFKVLLVLLKNKHLGQLNKCFRMKIHLLIKHLKSAFFLTIIFSKIFLQFIQFILNYYFSKKFSDANDSEIYQILVFRLQRLGDLLMTKKVINQLRKRYPRAKIDLITAKSNKKLQPIFKKDISAFLYYTSRKYHPRGDRQIPNLRSIIRKKYDLVIDFDGDFKTAFLIRSIRPKKYFSRGSYRLKELFLSKKKCISQIELPYKIAELSIYQNNFKCKEKNYREKIIEIHPYASGPNKYPDDEFYCRLINELYTVFADFQIYLTGYGNELIKLKKLAKATNTPIYSNPTDTLGVRLRKRVKLVICPDTFTMHFAAYLNAKVIALFGPQSPGRYSNYYNNVFPIYHKRSCSPCLYDSFGINFCPHNKACIRSIETKEIITIAKYILYDR